jgi:hypothetical protein
VAAHPSGKPAADYPSYLRTAQVAEIGVHVTLDRVPLGQGGQAALPEDARRPPSLPRSRDPRTGRGASRGGHGLAVQSSREAGLIVIGHHLAPLPELEAGHLRRHDGPAACQMRRRRSASPGLLLTRCGFEPRQPGHAGNLRQTAGRQGEQGTVRPVPDPACTRSSA